MNIEDKDDFLGRWLDGRLSEEEREAFESSEEFMIYRKIAAGASRFSLRPFDVESALNATKAEREKNSKSVVRSLSPVWSVAAAVVVLIGVYFFFMQADTLETGFGELAEQRLPDGSRARLNAKTTLRYDAGSWDQNRTVKLEGEAFFEVAKGTSFTVRVPQGIVQVLGTEFNVYARESFFEVSCYEGSVRVSGATEVVLEAGETYRQVGEVIEPMSSLAANAPAWVSNESVFEHSPIGAVLLELANQYQLTFEGKIPDDSTRITVSFPNDNRSLALELVFKSLQLTYQEQPDNVIIID